MVLCPAPVASAGEIPIGGDVAESKGIARLCQTIADGRRHLTLIENQINIKSSG